MVRSRPVFIFIALGAASIAGAAPLRFAASAEPASQEAASLCARFDQDKAGLESGNPQDCRRSELDVSSSEDYVLDMDSFSSSRDSSVVVPLPPFDSPSSQEHADADTASAPSIESPALHPSGPFVSPSSQECADVDDNSAPGIESPASHPSGPFDSPSSQERADVDDNSALSIKSPAPHSSGPFDSPSSQEHIDADTADVPGIEFPALHPSGPLYLPSIRERADADDTASVPGIASRAPHPSGLLEYFRRSLGVLSSRSSNAPLAHSLLRKRTDTEITSADDLQPTSAFSTSTPVNASSEQHMDAQEENDLEQGKIITTHSFASHVPDPFGPPQSFSVSNTLDHPLLQEHIDIDIASAHNIESRSPHPPGPLVVSHDMDAYYLSQIGETASAEEVVKVIKLNTGSYETDIQGRTSWADFLQTRAGQFWLVVDHLLGENRPTIDRESVQIIIQADIIHTLLHHNTADRYFLRDVYSVFRDWNSPEYWHDVRDTDSWYNFLSNKHSGKLLLRVYNLVAPPIHDIRHLERLVTEDIEHLTSEEKAERKMDELRESGSAEAFRNARGNFKYFQRQDSLYFRKYRSMRNWSTLDVQEWFDYKVKKAIRDAGR
ncbi:hypothetical protein C8R42DRAFT_708148 [Lentinula raphanica]|nr:hypothetical protein C8R42DRAFT_708148 [Lentinula raphanica]